MLQDDFENAAIALIKHKDIMRKNIIEIIPKNQGHFLLKTKTGDKEMVFQPKLDFVDSVTFVIENSSKNREFLIEKWDEFVKAKATLIFLETVTGASWSICPHIHQRIRGDGHIKKDISALSANM